MRLDLYLFESRLARSRTHAANLIKLGRVTVNGKAEFKGAREIGASDTVEVSGETDYASLGGIKLKKALDYFNISVLGKTAIDIGAANGGFTDVLLKGGAAKVFAVDVSDCALPEEIKSDGRVSVKERLNARYISFEDIGIKAGIITIDVSFISLKLIIPAMLQFMDRSSVLIALIKPQFEAGRAALSKSGIVTNKSAVKKVIDDITAFCKALSLSVTGVTEAPRPFADKNQEYLIACRLSASV